MSFTPINTQEEFDEIIKPRLQRERETVAKQYADYENLKADLKRLTEEKAASETSAKETAEKMKSLNDQLAAANLEVKKYKVDQLRTSAVLASGLPIEFKDRLTGETEEEISKDAASLAKLFKSNKSQRIPPFSQDEGVPASEEAARRQELKSLLSVIRPKGDNK